MEIFEFKDTFCVSLFKESKYNTSLKPNLLGNLFQNSVTIKCNFKINDIDKEQWLFSKQGIINSGVFIRKGLINFTLATTTNDSDFSNDGVRIWFEIKNTNTEFEIEYTIDADNNKLIASFNGQTKEILYNGKVSDYSNVPLWIGTSNPFVEQKNYLNGIITKFEIKNNDGVVTDLDFSNINRFKVWDKSGNGNFAYIEEYLNIPLQIKINKRIAGNSLETKDINNIVKTII
jgi:hypothetical protein